MMLHQISNTQEQSQPEVSLIGNIVDSVKGVQQIVKRLFQRVTPEQKKTAITVLFMILVQLSVMFCGHVAKEHMLEIRDGIHQIVSRFLERFQYMCPLLFSCVFPS
jgi:hypothetical protein